MSEKVVGRILFESMPVIDNIIKMQEVKRGSAKVLRLKCILQDADTPNRNGRVYPRAVLDKAIKTPFILEKLKTRSLLGEMNHPPPGSSLQRQMNVDLTNVSHLIETLGWDEKRKNLIVADVETTHTRVGQDMKGLIEGNGMICSFSMRGGGDVVTKGGYSYVKDPLRLITYDLVHFPSHQTAYMTGLNENVDEVLVTDRMLNEYIAEQSQNAGVVMEHLDCFGESFDCEVSSNGKTILFRDKTSRKPLGFSLLENRLSNEYEDILRNF